MEISRAVFGSLRGLSCEVNIVNIFRDLQRVHKGAMSDSFSLSDLDSPNKWKLSSPSTRLAAKFSGLRVNTAEEEGFSENMNYERMRLEKKARDAYAECAILKERAHAYALTTTLRSDASRPTQTSPSTLFSPSRSQPEAGEAYSMSPYGRELKISDYSGLCSPKRRRAAPPTSPLRDEK